MFARSGRGSVPIHKGQEKRRGDPEATPAPSRRSNWGRVISLPRSTIALKTPSWFNRFAIDRTSRRAAGLRTTCDRRTDIGIGRFSAVENLLPRTSPPFGTFANFANFAIFAIFANFKLFKL